MKESDCCEMKQFEIMKSRSQTKCVIDKEAAKKMLLRGDGKEKEFKK
jgi:hypothetical protein